MLIRTLLNTSYFARTATQPASKSVPAVITKSSDGTVKDKYRKYKKDGPELTIVRYLMINGPLSNK